MHSPNLPIFDIETAPLPFDLIKDQAPAYLLEEEPTEAVIAEFKSGLRSNLLPETVEKKVLEFSNSYDVEELRIKWMDKAQLDPCMSYVCWIVVKQDDVITHYSANSVEEEKGLLAKAWDILSLGGVGHNIFQFDLPFLTTRQWIQEMPHLLWRKGRYADSSRFIDTREEWEHGLGMGKRLSPASLDHISKVLGYETKPGAGKDFYKWMEDEDFTKCKLYAEHDVNTCEKIAKRIGAITK